VMLDENRIRDANLETYEDVKAWFELFDARYEKKKYYPVRVRCDELKGHFERAIVEFGWRSRIHNAEERIDEIDEMMLSSPEHNTIIFIKGFWRASKRLNRQHVGGCYEEIPKKQNTTSASQGLIARFCDTYEYDGDELNPDLRPIHFGDIESIKQYLNWFDCGCDFRNASYSSARITSDGTRVKKAAKSKVHADNMQGLDITDDGAEPDANVYEVSDEFTTYKDAERWALTNILFGEHNELLNKIKPTKVSATDASGGKTAKTHMSSRGNRGESRELILTREQLVQSGDLSRWGNGVRCVPVLSTISGGPNNYVIVYKTSWKRIIGTGNSE